MIVFSVFAAFPLHKEPQLYCVESVLYSLSQMITQKLKVWNLAAKGESLIEVRRAF